LRQQKEERKNEEAFAIANATLLVSNQGSADILGLFDTAEMEIKDLWHNWDSALPRCKMEAIFLQLLICIVILRKALLQPLLIPVHCRLEEAVWGRVETFASIHWTVRRAYELKPPLLTLENRNALGK
jgi:hypothetical protein